MPPRRSEIAGRPGAGRLHLRGRFDGGNAATLMPRVMSILRVAAHASLTAMFVVHWARPVAAATPSPVEIRPSGPDEITVELPKGGPPIVEAEAREAEAVLPAGQEDRLAEMMGRGETLPGGCKFAAGNINGPAMIATYDCSSGPVVIKVVHPSKAPRGAEQTAQFALAAERGTTPEGLLEALADRVRAREAGFQWNWLGGGPPPASNRPLVWSAAGAVVALGVLFGLLRLRRRR